VNRRLQPRGSAIAGEGFNLLTIVRMTSAYQ
jgi:hypothetical protein